MQVQFSTDDLRTPESLERVLRQFEAAIAPSTPAIRIPTIGELVGKLAPLLRDQLQAPGGFPLNLQSLLPSIVSASFQEDTHANRLVLYPTPTILGAGFLETDRNVIYIGISSGGALVWRYAAGVMYGTLASIPADLGTNDTGFCFVNSNADQNSLYVWTGTEFITVDYLQSILDTTNNALTTVQVLEHLVAGAGAANMGVRQLTRMRDDAPATVEASAVNTEITVAAAATFTTKWSVQLRSAGAALANFFQVLVTDIRWNVGGFFGIFVHANTANRTYTFPDKNTIFDHGTYTPTLTNVSNLDASTAYACQYLRVGNTVTVSGQFDANATTAATDTLLSISLPIASTFAASNQLGGVAMNNVNAGNAAAIYASGGIARVQWLPSVNTNQSYLFTFTYLVV